ncbi:MAG: hypothetical protein ABTR27_00595 [Candidatus Competibacter phosphatis]
MKPAVIWPMLVVLLLSPGAVMATPGAKTPTNGNHLAHYVELYGLADPKQEPAIDRAYALFEQVRSVADRN